MPKKNLKLMLQKAQKQFNVLDRRLKVAIYVFAVFLVLSLIQAMRAGEIEVIGTHSVQETNKLATYIISVSDRGSNKELVMENVAKSGNDLRGLLLEFGLDESDIMTTNNYIFEESENQSVRFAPANQKIWVGGTSVEVKLKDITRVGEFAGVLSGLSNLEVYGPTYSIDEDDINESALLSAAVKNAKQKAVSIAGSQNKKLGRILSIEELASSTYGVYGEVMGMGGGETTAEFSPGSTKIVKSVKVRFVLK